MSGGVSKRIVGFWQQYVLDIIYPKYCLGCQKEGDYYCSVCQQQEILPWNGVCFGCKKISLHNKICENCRDDYFFDGVICLANYEDKVISSLIQACKYNFVKELGKILGQLLAVKLAEIITQSNLFSDKFFSAEIMPVPLSSRRYNWRGFNQAEEIAATISSYFSLKLNTNLKRLKHVKPQAKLSEQQRLTNLKDCFAVTLPLSSLVFLVDDVITTGATVNECARVLKNSGVAEVWVLTIAKG